MNIKETWKKWFRRDNLLILILSGVLLFIIALPTKDSGAGEGAGRTGNADSADGPGRDGTQQGDSVGLDEDLGEADYVSRLEEKLENILSQMSGVGKVKVMITLNSSEELVVEKDEPMSRSNTNETDSAGGSRIVTQLEETETTVYRTSGSESEPYVVKTISPQVQGVVVVAEGAGNGTVNRNITEMVQALFGLEAHKVKVVKMASEK